MGLFDSGKKGPEEPAPQAPPETSTPPTDKIMTMRQQGLDNNAIIQSLQREGYSSDNIFKAMNQADISAGIEG